jgi:hypothetical protein
MTEFQKIAIGLLGLTHPETRAASLKAAASPAANADPESYAPGSGALLQTLRGRAAGIIRSVEFMLAALSAGSRTVALADNSEPLRDLRARAARLYGSE